MIKFMRALLNEEYTTVDDILKGKSPNEIKSLVNNPEVKKGFRLTLNDILIEAASRGYKDVVMGLIDAGASVNYRDYDGNTGAELAIKNGHKETAQAILNTVSEVNNTRKSAVMRLLEEKMDMRSTNKVAR